MGAPLQAIAKEAVEETVPRWIESGMTRLSKEGGPLGEELVQRLQRWHEGWRAVAGPGVQAIKTNPTLNAAQRETMGRLEQDTGKAISTIQHLGSGHSELKRIVQGMYNDPKIGPSKAKHAWLTSMHFIGRPYAVNLGGGSAFHTGEVPGLARGNLEKAANWWNVVGKLSLAPLAHTVQPLNVPLKAGFGPAIKGLLDAIGSPKAAARMSLEQGPAVEDMLRQWHSLANDEFMGKTSRLIMKPLNLLTNAYKTWATASAPYVLDDLQHSLLKNPQDKTALRKLASLDISLNDLMRPGAKQALAGQAARRLSDIMFPETNVLSVPSAWRMDPYARTFTMFKPFLFKQAKFLYDNVFMELKLGNPKPFIAMAMLYPGLSHLGTYARSAIREGTLDPNIPPMDREHWADRMLWNASQVGGLTIFSDVIGAFGMSNMWRGMTSFALGPVLSGAFSTLEELRNVVKSNNPWLELEKDLKREVVSEIPFIGSPLSHRIEPRKPSKSFPYKQMMQGKLTEKVNKVLGISSRGDTEAPKGESDY